MFSAGPDPVSSAVAGDDRSDPSWWERRYAEGDVPWDTGITPPEVVALVETGQIERGWALDLGCGSGVTSRYLAANGFRVIGVDLSLFALSRGQQAAAALGLRCHFLRASVADLSFLRIRASLAVDVGCFHSLAPDARVSYVRSLAARLVPGAYYLLYTFVRLSPADEAGETAGPAVGLSDIARFAPWFTLRAAAHGEDRGRTSSWFLMRRTDGAVTASV